MDDAALTGTVLLLIAPLLAFDGFTSVRAGFDAGFWRRPLQDKLDHIVERPQGWKRLGLVWLPILILACGGMTSFSWQLAEAGAGALSFLALGAFLLGSFAWLVGVLLQTGVVLEAAQVRARNGETPDWLEGLWHAAWWSELTYVLATNAAFVVWGIGMLDVGFPARWIAWTMLAIAAVTIALAAATRNVFPHLGVLLPIVLGVALVAS